ncbi:MAG: UDP-N-acetylmuramate dehydrogenase [Candidatus Cloacimonadaceae bacterium]
MDQHCSFRIGGPADVFCEPDSVTQLIELLQFAVINRINYFVLGKGSNILISDKGMEGLVIHTTRLNRIGHDEHCVSAQCGASLKDLCDYAQKLGLAGLEFASGIPGSVGGAVYMNAGAYGGEIKDVLRYSKYLEPSAQGLRSFASVKHLKAAAHLFGYRSSVFQTSGWIHLSSLFSLTPDDPEAIAERMRELEKQRWSKQPMDLPSGGSVFKRPQGHFTGRLVDDCGLRGFQIGGAAISNKHCGFIVNLGSATAADVLALIEHVQKKVLERFGVLLEPELRLIGRQ